MTRARPSRVMRAIAGSWRWFVMLSLSGAIVVLVAWLMLGPGRSIATERWGVDQMHIRRSAQGHMLDLRYRVVDPKQAKSLLSASSEVYLLHKRSGRRLTVPSTPKAGPLRTTGEPQLGRSYFALFSNPGGLVRRGDRVSVVVGDLITDLKVE